MYDLSIALVVLAVESRDYRMHVLFFCEKYCIKLVLYGTRDDICVSFSSI